MRRSGPGRISMESPRNTLLVVALAQHVRHCAPTWLGSASAGGGRTAGDGPEAPVGATIRVPALRLRRRVYRGSLLRRRGARLPSGRPPRLGKCVASALSRGRRGGGGCPISRRVGRRSPDSLCADRSKSCAHLGTESRFVLCSLPGRRGRTHPPHHSSERPGGSRGTLSGIECVRPIATRSSRETSAHAVR